MYYLNSSIEIGVSHPVCYNADNTADNIGGNFDNSNGNNFIIKCHPIILVCTSYRSVNYYIDLN